MFQITLFLQNQCLFLQEKTSRLCFQHALKHKCSPFAHALRMIRTFSKLSASSELSLEHSSKPVLNKALKLIVDDFINNKEREIDFLGNMFILSDLRAD